MIKIQTAFFAMMVVVASSNYLVQFPLNDWLTWGAFTYPFSFLITELTNRFYGAKMARKVVYVGFFLAVFISMWLATPKIAFASVSAFLVSQLLDILIFNSLRGMHWWYAPFFASLLASFTDTVIFWNLAFLGEEVPLFTWACGDFLVKLLLDILMILPFRFFLNKEGIRRPV